MDFHSLSRKDLQALSKKNKIPANITNVSMAGALSALPQVEGLDEILNPREGDIGTPSIQIRSASRITTQRNAVKEPESSKVSTRPSRGTRTRVAEGVVEQENKNAKVSATSAMVPSTRRRVPAVSTRRKKEVVEDGDDGKNGVQEKPKDVPKTPAMMLFKLQCAGSELLPELEDYGDSAKLENKECNETKQDAISFEACEEASMEVADGKDVSSTEEVLEIVANDYVNQVEPMHDHIDTEGVLEKDSSLNKVCIEVEDVAVQLPLLGSVQNYR